MTAGATHAAIREPAVPIHSGRRSREAPARRSRAARQALLVAHIAAAGAWIGIDVVLGVLVLTGMVTGSASTEAIAYQALGLFAVWPLIISGATTLATGVALGLATRYGLIRYWWVAAKLVINVVLVTLVVFALRPSVADAVRYGEAIEAGMTTTLAVDAMVFPPVVSLLALTAATVLSVYKPWGRRRP